MTMTSINKSDFYCSQKFWWLTVDIEKIQSLSCCSATPTKIDVKQLSETPGQLFNSEQLKKERQMMLDNVPVSGCFSCWNAEQDQLPSRRLEMGSNKITHTDINAVPETLHIVVGSHCNMTCSYCCKQYSTAWKQDIIRNGLYPVESTDDRFVLNSTDKILAKISQKELAGSDLNATLLAEIEQLVNLHPTIKIIITGGEPFLYLNLNNLISKFPTNTEIEIWTGLGVNEARFSNELDRLSKFSNVRLTVSAENIKTLYEFNRYGNTWQRFENNLEQLKKRNISYSFNTTISNISVFGLEEFFDYIQDAPYTYGVCMDPDYLGLHVMDDYSKQQVLNNITRIPEELQNTIARALAVDPTDHQVFNFKNYITEFAQRRNLALSVFPKSFSDWISL